jgi:hypothetical protein
MLAYFTMRVSFAAGCTKCLSLQCWNSGHVRECGLQLDGKTRALMLENLPKDLARQRNMSLLSLLLEAGFASLLSLFLDALQ